MSDFTTLDEVFDIIKSRKKAGLAEKSYTAKLFTKGRKKIAQKLGEESVETVIAATVDDKQETISESADMLFHLLVLWVDMGVSPKDVMRELKKRKGVSGLDEKKSRKE